MKDRRLWVILTIFVCITGLAIFGSIYFKVKTIECYSLADFEYFAEGPRAEELYATLAETTKYLKGKNIFLGVNRDEIKRRIEEAEPRIKVNVKGIKAEWPNKLIIPFRERFSVYYYNNGERGVVLDKEMRILELADNIDNNKEIIDISGKIETTDAFNDDTALIGKYLTEFLSRDDDSNLKAERLIDVAELFESMGDGEGNKEGSFKHMFASVSFSVGGVNFEEQATIDMTLNFRLPADLQNPGKLPSGPTTLKICDIENDDDFNYMFAAIYDCFEKNLQESGDYHARVDGSKIKVVNPKSEETEYDKV
ncbi:MAG: hypothetical protein LBM01_02360 [Christensenellaceae bacterium]|jgi:hypothetical protein|nr:hypothetical protein [Christensenellaceae bacterium]